MTSNDDTLAVLREIRDQQRVQVERQAEALALQRQQYEMYRQQFDRAEKLQDRAEALQARHAKALVFARVILWVAVPALALLLAMAAWPYVVNLWA
jgi:uncharacterized membrane protein